MGLRDAISAVPAKPIIAIAAGLTVFAAAWHGWTLHKICSQRSALTSALHSWAGDAMNSGPAGARLDKATGFDWNQVRILQAVKKPSPAPNCPFGWHLSNREREAMARTGNLTLVGFAIEGNVIEIVDFDATKARFDVGKDPISRDGAIFRAQEGVLALVPR
ncbi:MAG: hypothetical protein ACR2OR_11965 [Hyphomicrobiales bacterium]